MGWTYALAQSGDGSLGVRYDYLPHSGPPARHGAVTRGPLPHGTL